MRSFHQTQSTSLKTRYTTQGTHEKMKRMSQVNVQSICVFLEWLHTIVVPDVVLKRKRASSCTPDDVKENLLNINNKSARKADVHLLTTCPGLSFLPSCHLFRERDERLFYPLTINKKKLSKSLPRWTHSNWITFTRPCQEIRLFNHESIHWRKKNILRTSSRLLWLRRGCSWRGRRHEDLSRQKAILHNSKEYKSSRTTKVLVTSGGDPF